MIDERMFNLLRDQLAFANEDRARAYEQNRVLLEEVHMLRQAVTQGGENIQSQLKEYQEQLKEYQQRVEHLTSIIKAKDEKIASLEQALLNAKNNNQLNNGKRFGRTSEQQKLLNNRNVDTRAEEEAVFDGKSAPEIKNQEQPTPTSKKKKKNSSIRTELEKKHVDKTIVHRLNEYHVLPEGAHYITRNGQIDTTWYEYIEVLPAQVIKHVYEVARVAMADGESIVSSLPEEVKLAAVEGCPFTPEMLAFIYCEKYAYHSSINTVKKKLRNMGAIFSKSTLNRYYQKGIDALMECLEETLLEEVCRTDYLMVDETCELVCIEDEVTGEKSYKKRYLWAFYDKIKKLVSYVYENGSRASKVVLKFLEKFKGFISTDGYIAYKIFEDADKHPDITRCGCWTHARRNFVDSLVSDRKNSTKVLECMAELFGVEHTCKLLGMTAAERQAERQKRSIPILTRLYALIKTLSKDTVVMANALMAKAVNYVLNQWQNLRNFIMDGKVEISNNLVEQRMKTIKLDMKNCQNIGSEDAARRAAFMHSLFESCSLQRISPYEYITELFYKYKSLDQAGKINILPCYYLKNY